MTPVQERQLATPSSDAGLVEPRRGRQRTRGRSAAVLAVQLFAVALVLGLWELSSRAGWIDTFFWSRPTLVIEAGRRLAASGRLFEDAMFTLRSTMLGFAIGTTAGSSFGLLLWWSRFAARVTEPFVVALNAVPKLAFAPLLILVFGLGVASKVAVVVALTIVTATLTAYAGVRAVDDDLLQLLRSLGASRMQTFVKVVVPSTVPWMLSGMRVNIGLALTGAMVAEMVGSEHGLGRLILFGGAVYDISVVWVGALTLAALAVAMYAIVTAIEKRLLRGLLHGASAR